MEGPSRGLLDFSAVKTVDLEASRVVAEGQKRQIMQGQQRIFVAPGDQLFGLLRMYAVHQEIGGEVEPIIVRSLKAAHMALGLDDPVFEPIEC